MSQYFTKRDNQLNGQESRILLVVSLLVGAAVLLVTGMLRRWRSNDTVANGVTASVVSTETFEPLPFIPVDALPRPRQPTNSAQIRRQRQRRARRERRVPSWVNAGTFAIAFVGLLVILFVLPRPYSTYMLGGVGIVALLGAIGWWITGWLPAHEPQTQPQVVPTVAAPQPKTSATLPSLEGILQSPLFKRAARPDDVQAQPLPRSLQLTMYIVELCVVVGVALWVTNAYWMDNPTFRLNGGEAEWITSSVYYSSIQLREYGFIPQWQSTWEFGHPLVGNAVAFVVNPIGSIPSLLTNGVQGVKISAALVVVSAGVGGWVLGYALGLGPLGRVLLGMLLLGRANLTSTLREGYLQLAGSQSLIPLVIAGLILIFRKQSRYPIVLTALAFTLLFTWGNLWFALPTVIVMAVLTLALLPTGDDRVLHWGALRRLAIAGVLTIGLSMVILLPVALEFDQIGNHPDENGAGWDAYMTDVLGTFFQKDTELRVVNESYELGYEAFWTWDFWGHIYISYVSPLWFMVLIFVLLPPIPALYKASHRDHWRIWVVGILLLVFFTVWGAGGNPVMIWLYESIAPLRQWRFVGRALAVATLWLAVLIAMRVDGLWQMIIPPSFRSGTLEVRLIRYGLAAVLAGVSLYAAADVADFAQTQTLLEQVNDRDAKCLEWIREQNPDAELAVYQRGYEVASAFMDYDLRLSEVEADLLYLPIDDTIGNYAPYPTHIAPYAIGLIGDQREHVGYLGYVPVNNSPEIFDNASCVFTYEASDQVLNYAFTLPLATAEASQLRENFPADITTPVSTFERHPDRIAVRIDEGFDEPTVLTVQENSYPGWAVWVNGKRADLETMAGLTSVLLLPGEDGYYVRFQFIHWNLIIGGVVTILTALFSIAYLLRLDVWWQRRRGESTETANHLAETPVLK